LNNIDLFKHVRGNFSDLSRENGKILISDQISWSFDQMKYPERKVTYAKWIFLGIEGVWPEEKPRVTG